MAQPEAMSQAKPGQNGSFLTALARPGVLKSQSQAIRLWLWQVTGDVCLWGLEVWDYRTSSNFNLHGHTCRHSLSLFIH